MAIEAIKDFMKMESAGGIVLFFAAVIAFVIANSPLSPAYEAVLNTPLVVTLGGWGLDKPLLLWINDGLMAVFFFLVGLEIKREICVGELSSREKLTMPLIMAIGGMVVPALIYAAVNWPTPYNISGWAIPAATDIAFALGVLSLLGKRVPFYFKVLLTAIAIIDDLGAILIIALFYSKQLALVPLVIAGGLFVLLVLFNRKGVQSLSLYIFLGVVLWLAVLKSGVHATLAGVLLAFTIPISSKDGSKALLYELEHGLHKWVVFLVLPFFAFANSGVNVEGVGLEIFTHPVTVGIILGLFLGKPLGIFGLAWLSHKAGLAKLPNKITWAQTYSLSTLCGIGFTMSLFIGGLAFDDRSLETFVKVGVLSGSLLAGIFGFAALYFLGQPKISPKVQKAKKVSI